MRSATRSALSLLAAAAILSALPVVLAHGHDDAAAADADMDMDMDMGADKPQPDPDSYLPTYFTHPEHRGLIYAHVALMVLGWVVMLPIGVMFSLARSRYTLAVQFVFVATNALALLLGMSYNAQTPDLYPNNAHHKIGWIATWVVSAQVLISLVGHVAGIVQRDDTQKHTSEERQAFIPISAENMAEHQRMNDAIHLQKYRNSYDSGQGTEPNTESLRSNSLSHSSGHQSPTSLEDRRMDYDEDDDLELKPVELNPSKPQSRGLVAKIAGKISTRTWKVLLLGYNVIDRTTLILGYIALLTGIVTWARFFEGHAIFTGLAHWIKGSVFVWYGLLTLGRWSGSFGELGWAWNVRPKQSSKKWKPSAEFVEGFLIFFYGSTNIFLEHLGNDSVGNAEFSPQDLEHVSITVLFIGGGLLAMLIESTNIRELLNTTVSEAALSHPDSAYNDEEREALRAPKQYEFSINPIPALVILLLGIMMSSHTQHSMLSSMVHKQWGNLLTGASLARGFTYVLMYIRQPRSIMPSRPPTELLTAFGLIAGGIIFCASSGDTVEGMVHYDLDAMFFYTVTLGFVGLLMAWVVLLLALKGWAILDIHSLLRYPTKLGDGWFWDGMRRNSGGRDG
ncbi:integral membrane protein [Seiridium cupressi]